MRRLLLCGVSVDTLVRAGVCEWHRVRQPMEELIVHTADSTKHVLRYVGTPGEITYTNLRAA